MDFYTLTPKGAVVSKSTNGSTDKNSPDYARWKILYQLKFLHYADKEKLVAVTGLTPSLVSSALTYLKLRGYVYNTSDTGG